MKKTTFILIFYVTQTVTVKQIRKNEVLKFLGYDCNVHFFSDSYIYIYRRKSKERGGCEMGRRGGMRVSPPPFVRRVVRCVRRSSAHAH